MRWGRSRPIPQRALAEFTDAAHAAVAANPVARRDPTLPDRVVGYLRDGADTGVLTALRAAHSGGWASSWDAAEGDPRRELYRRLGSVPAEAGLRWAHVLESFGHWGLTLAPVAGGDWAELLVDDIGKCFLRGAVADRVSPPVTHADIERIVVAGGGRPGELLAATFSYSTLTPPAGNSTAIGARPISRAYAGNFHGARATICALSDYRVAVAAHAAELAGLAEHPGKGAATIVALLEYLDADGLRPFATAIAKLLTGATTSVALSVEKLAVRCPAPELTDALQQCAVTGSSAQQLRALRALWKAHPSADTRSWAMDFVTTATSAAARALAREWADLPTGTTFAPGAPPPPAGSGAPGDWQIEITPALRTVLDRFRADINSAVDGQIRQYQASDYPNQRQLAERMRHFTDADLTALIATLRAPGPPSRRATPKDIRDRTTPLGIVMPTSRAMRNLGGTTGLSIETILTIFCFVDCLRYPAGDRGLTWEAVDALNTVARHSATRHGTGLGAPLTLARIQELLDQLGLAGTDLVFDAYAGLSRGLPDDAAAHFVQANLTRFADLLTAPPDHFSDGATPYRALATLPAIPEDVAGTIFQVALGTSGRNRELAQDTLAHDPRRTARLYTAIHAGDADTRAVAAAWLGRSGTRADIPELESAYHAEKSDRVSQIQLDALAALGNPASTYLNRDTLTAAASKGLRKGPPALVSWIDWTQLPTLRWTGTDDTVDISIVQWLIASAAKLKSPEPTVALRYYCALFAPSDAERLGDYLLDLWITVDHQGGPVSAIKCKGMLALCAATCGDAAAPVAEHEIRSRYGYAAAQCRALLGMLSWIDRPNAVALILSIATRFRTKGIQTEAQKQVDALAARRGWTRAELADRTVPDAGFGTDGRLILDYGPRQFTARIGDDLALHLYGTDGTPVKSLPAPRVTDDDTAVTAAKKLLATARKAVKTLVPQQVQRLEEAMYAQRRWAVADWEHHLHHHPIVTILCRRLVWAELDPDGVVRQTFRPLDDGTLTDATDAEGSLGAESSITLVHPGLVDAPGARAWHDHLADYEVSGLFDQFGPGYELSGEQRSAQTVTAFEGHLIEAFALRGMARKLGYTRGPTGDGGVFFSYVKTYPSLGLTAQLGFSGNQLPEENTTVALTELRYVSVDDGSSVPLRDIPVLLLGASHRDVAAVAAAGTGFDPDWRGKVEYA